MKVFCTYCGAANPGDRLFCDACATPLEAPRSAVAAPTTIGQIGTADYGGQGVPVSTSSASPWPGAGDGYAGARTSGPLYTASEPYEDPALPYLLPYTSAAEPYGQPPDPASLYPAQYPSPQPYGQAYPSQQAPGPYAPGSRPYQQDPYAPPPYADQGYGTAPSYPQVPGYPQVPAGYSASGAQPYPQPLYPPSAYGQPAYPAPLYPQPGYTAPQYPQPYPSAPGYSQGYGLMPQGGPGSLASTLPRFGSYLFDTIMFSIIFLVLGTIVGGLNLGTIGALLLLAVHPLYYIGFWGTAGQTPGYKAAGLQLVRSDGTKVGFGAAIIRYIGFSVTVPLFLLGCLWMIWDYKKQALYDKMADTLVIRA